ncbi:Creatinase Prolidase N terminal domain [Trypanosoma vivax]|uniref:Putative aminopeptidase P1 n=1 Tax=Trypanosoma vivax (strain Y486) TaxID=1055687 RepID=G0TSM7_TRYVY|nr:putative aminopeptidase P1 [Trypanosoma vivax]KAH8605375.1 Creatinase Prolidase N terminal domain [Trypanosoma vivax]CCC46954.1 putative aminopeptidase P1 [Trypanosoma vivax Y486]
MSMSVGAQLLKRVREAMREHALGALIVPSSDPHNSEYVMDDFKCRAFLTNFSGSAGTCLITMEEAYLWTDGRYWLEASNTLYPEWKLMRDGKPDTPTLEDFVRLHLGSATRVGMNDNLSTVAEWERRSKLFNLVPVPELVRPLMPSSEKTTTHTLTVRPKQFCGQTRAEKVAALLKAMEPHKCNAIIVSALDEVAWLTNLRGNDVPFNPVFYSYVVVHCAPDPVVTLFVDPSKLTDEVQADVSGEGGDIPLQLKSYDALEEYLGALPAGTKFLIDEHQTSRRICAFLEANDMKLHRVKCGPVQMLKAIKNEVEIEGFRQCHIRDGVALTRYLAWLHDTVAVKRDPIVTEYSGASVLEGFRRVGDNFVQLSFPTISSVGSNAAIVHYTPPTGLSAAITPDKLYLVDSGAQYLDGTTDVTRTVCFQQPTAEEREAYTLVLKGNLALHNAVWPVGTSGHRLDALARQPLWQAGLDYSHGTGHGVGSFLNVHEGPQGIGIRPVPTEATLTAGMVVSNEPGFYKAGSFGIRIENLELVVSAPTKYSPDGFLKFETLTMVPLCRELINTAALTPEERRAVDEYHQTVREKLTPHLRRCRDNRALAYLEHHTAPL